MTAHPPILRSSAGDSVFNRLAPVLAALLVTVLYAAASWSNQFVYDDHEVIENLFPIRHASDVAEIFRAPHYLNFPYYRPITRSTFALQKSVWGNNPRPYHLFNAVLAGLVLLAAYGLLRRPMFGISWPAAVIAALWFSLHPALSECIYPAASGRETLFPALVMLLAAWAYLHPGRLWYWLAIVLLGVALLCKEQAVMLPMIFLLADFLNKFPSPGTPGEDQGGGFVRRSAFDPHPSPPPEYQGRGKEGIQLRALENRSKIFILRLLPSILVLLAYFFVRHKVLSSSLPRLAIADHPLAPFQAILFGLQTAFMPFIQLHYEPRFDVWFNPAMCAISIAAGALLILAIAKCSSQVRRNSLFWLGWFMLLQLPTAHILAQEAEYSERYCALAILAIPATAAMVLQERINAKRAGKIVLVAALAWVAMLGCISFGRGSAYRNDGTFSTRWIATDPASPTAHAGRAYWARERHDIPTAVAEYQTALQYDPHLASAHSGLADIAAEQGDYVLASAHYQEVLRDDPRNVAVLVNYAQMLGSQAYSQRSTLLRDQARDLLKQAVAINPNYARAHFILAIWHQAFGTKQEAIGELQKALRLQPDFAEARKTLEKLR